MTERRASATSGVFVCATMPSATGVVQAVWSLGSFSICTAQRRQAPASESFG